MREEGLVTMPDYLIETWRVAPIPSITNQLMALAEGHTSCPAPLPRTGTCDFAGLVCHEQIANNAPAKCSCSMAKQTGAAAAAAGTQPSPVQSKHHKAAINAKCKPLGETKTSAQLAWRFPLFLFLFPFPFLMLGQLQPSCKSLMQSSEFTTERPIKPGAP